MNEILRLRPGVRSSPAVSFGDLIFLAGQVGSEDGSIEQQTREVLAKIDSLLAECGSDKGRILQATIWLADINDFEAMNRVWNVWVEPGTAPARATSESRLAGPYLVEIIVTAARHLE